MHYETYLIYRGPIPQVYTPSFHPRSGFIAYSCMPTRLNLLTTKPETQKNQECWIISGKLWLCFCKWRKPKCLFIKQTLYINSLGTIKIDIPVSAEHEVCLTKKCLKIMLHGRDDQLDGLWELHLIRQLRQETFINTVRYFSLFCGILLMFIQLQ